MPTIRDLSEVSSLSGADAIPVSVASQSDARKASLTTLLSFIEANFASPDYTTQINAPSSSGSSIMLDDQTGNLWLIINPTGAFAALTLVLPTSGNAYDGQQVLVTCSNSITALTINGNGATVVGEPTGLGVGGFFTLRYNKLQATWYCVSQSLGATQAFTKIDFTANPGVFYDVNGNVALRVITNYTPPAVGGTNFVSINNRSTGNAPAISAQGVDTDIGIQLFTKGAGNMTLSATGGQIQLDGASCVVGTTVRLLPCTLAVANTAITLYNEKRGARATITDATAAFTSANVGSTITGGGANLVPAWYDGTVWKIGG